MKKMVLLFVSLMFAAGAMAQDPADSADVEVVVTFDTFIQVVGLPYPAIQATVANYVASEGVYRWVSTNDPTNPVLPHVSWHVSSNTGFIYTIVDPSDPFIFQETYVGGDYGPPGGGDHSWVDPMEGPAGHNVLVEAMYELEIHIEDASEPVAGVWTLNVWPID